MTLKLNPDNPLSTPVQTRDGRKARLICVDKKNADGYVLVVLVTDVEDRNNEYTHWYQEDGKVDKHNTCSSPSDLINVPVKHTGWVNIYRKASRIYPTKEEADSCSGSDRIACIKIEFEEGEGIE